MTFNEAENARLRADLDRAHAAWDEAERERDAARRGILELYHLEMITMSRARELMGLEHISPVREMYAALRPEFDKEFGDMGYAGRDS